MAIQKELDTYNRGGKGGSFHGKSTVLAATRAMLSSTPPICIPLMKEQEREKKDATKHKTLACLPAEAIE